MKLITQLKERLQGPLPGIDAQLKMMSTGMKKKDSNAYFKASEDAKKACVMLLLFKKEGDWHTALMQRPESSYPHSKQISFPGGGLEAIDASLEAGALRETEEEFGIPSRNIETIGRLTDLYIPVSGYLVHPFVGYLEEAPTYIPDPNEVSEIIEVRIADLLNPELRKMTNMEIFGGHTLKDTPYYDLNNKVVWGATAMMLSEFVDVLETLEEI
jgi:8-oxo-dGTP pyrophosphatase MutT (NUDIX family)